MNVTRDITSSLQRAAYGSLFNVILIASLVVVRNDSPWPLSFLVVGLGLASAAGIFALLSVRALQRVRQPAN